MIFFKAEGRLSINYAASISADMGHRDNANGNRHFPSFRTRTMNMHHNSAAGTVNKYAPRAA